MSAAPSPPLLELRAVAKAYPLADGRPGPPVLRDASLTLQTGESVAIVGPSGCGKSTLLHLIGGLDQADRGAVLLAGRDLEALSADELARVRNAELGFVFQQHFLLPQCSVLENVLVPTIISRQDAVARARQLLDRVGLGPHLAKRPGRLSGGECQRVALVRALINQPRLLLADEPTGALDQETAAQLAALLLELNREEGLALLVVTHSPDLAARLGRTLTLDRGRLQA